MSSIKTFMAMVLIGTMSISASSGARAFGADEQLKFFAQCAGRLSAQMEFQWMFDGIASEKTKRERKTVLEILDSMTPEGRGREILHWRIEAKQAQAVLLSRGQFDMNQRQARVANRMALRHLNECRSVLIS